MRKLIAILMLSLTVVGCEMPAERKTRIERAAAECGYHYDYESNAFYECLRHRDVSSKECNESFDCDHEARMAGLRRIVDDARSERLAAESYLNQSGKRCICKTNSGTEYSTDRCIGSYGAMRPECRYEK